MSRVTTLLTIAAALALTVGIGSAGAHKKKTFTKTTIAFQALSGSTGDRISGVVSLGLPPEEPEPSPPVEPSALGPLASAAARGNCVRGTTVEITQFLTSEGGGQASTPTVVATATTDATGAWETTAYEAAGANQLKFDTFKAKVVKKRLPPKNARHKHVCFGAGANKTTFSPSPDP
jgi:hypothetical protein